MPNFLIVTILHSAKINRKKKLLRLTLIVPHQWLNRIICSPVIASSETTDCNCFFVFYLFNSRTLRHIRIKRCVYVEHFKLEKVNKMSARQIRLNIVLQMKFTFSFLSLTFTGRFHYFACVCRCRWCRDPPSKWIMYSPSWTISTRRALEHDRDVIN